LNLLENSSAVQESNGKTGNKTTQRIASDANLLDVVSILCKFFQFLFHLTCDALATCVYAIVREAASVALCYQDRDSILWEPLTKAVADIFEVFRIAP
jgi:hypothetical protein